MKRSGLMMKCGAIGAVVAGTLVLSGCTTQAPVVNPSVTASPSQKPSEQPSATPATSQVFESKVPRIRDNWVVNRAALEELGSLVRSANPGDPDAMRAEVCAEFLANNPLDGDFGAPTRSDQVEVVEARFEAKQQLLRAYISDVYRNGTRADSDYDLLAGVASCLINSVAVQGSHTGDSLRVIGVDGVLPSITTSPKEYSIKDRNYGFARTAFVTVTVEGRGSADLWRRFLWKDATQDWDITNEQVENPYNLGWN